MTTSTMDDCFTPGAPLMRLEEALDLLAARVAPVTGTETVSLGDARGRVLAADVVASRDVPPHDNSAVDGYAVFFDDLDLDRETRLPLGGRIAAGHPLDRPARRGQALRIFTGGPMPEGPDTVLMQEDVRIEDGQAVFAPGIKRGANRRPRAEDVRAGATVIRAGQPLRAQEIGLAASLGSSTLEVHRRLRAAVFSTGDEIRDPGSEAPPGCIFDANRFAVMGLLEGLGCKVTDLGILADEVDAIGRALGRAAGGHDLLITSGGVSLGDEDHVKAAVEARGSLHFWRLAIKPGRPIVLGQVEGTAFIGLPGNPVAAIVTFMRIARPVVLRLSGRTSVAPQMFRVRAGFAHAKKTGRREWLRARLESDGDGSPVAVKHPTEGSGILTSMVESDGLVELPEDRGPVAEGETVDFLPFSEVT